MNQTQKNFFELFESFAHTETKSRFCKCLSSKVTYVNGNPRCTICNKLVKEKNVKTSIMLLKEASELLNCEMDIPVKQFNERKRQFIIDTANHLKLVEENE
jgi:hypothetical protein